MDIPFLGLIDLDILIFTVVFVGAVMMMKFLPRLMAGVPFVDPREIHEMIKDGKDVLVIDVRSPSEFTGNLGHVDGALNLQANELADRLGGAGGELDSLKNEPVCVVCRSENRSPRAAKLLTRAGFTNVCIMKTGMAGWNRQGFPVEK